MARREKRKRPGLPPLSVQIEVARRQVADAPEISGTPKRELAVLLGHIAAAIGCELSDLQLDHDPLLRARAYRLRPGLPVADWYEPHAHDPDYLRWRSKRPQDADSHHTKTFVRGPHGQLSDVVLAKRARRHEKDPERWSDLRSLKKPQRRRQTKPVKRSVGIGRKTKVKIPSRPFNSKGKRPFRRQS